MRRYFRVKWILADLLKTLLFGSTPVEKWGERVQRFGTHGKDKGEPAGRPYRTSQRYKEKPRSESRDSAVRRKRQKAKDGEDTGLKTRHYNKSKTNQEQDAGLKLRR